MTKMKITLVLVLLVLLSCSVALASPVKYSTCYGTTASPCAASGTFSVGTLTAKYTDSPTVTVPDPIALHGLNRNFGSLAIKCSPSCPSTATASFSVTISQILPGTGSAKVTATLSGTFVITNGTVSVEWSGPVAIHAGGFTTIYNPLDTGKTCHAPCTIALKVDITQVAGTVFLPEPSAELLLGLGSLSLMVLATLSRKMISA
jgi:hypothetical protein